MRFFSSSFQTVNQKSFSSSFGGIKSRASKPPARRIICSLGKTKALEPKSAQKSGHLPSKLTPPKNRPCRQSGFSAKKDSACFTVSQRVFFALKISFWLFLCCSLRLPLYRSLSRRPERSRGVAEGNSKEREKSTTGLRLRSATVLSPLEEQIAAAPVLLASTSPMLFPKCVLKLFPERSRRERIALCSGGKLPPRSGNGTAPNPTKSSCPFSK